MDVRSILLHSRILHPHLCYSAQRPCQSWRLQVVCCGPPAPGVGILWTDIARVDAAKEVVAALSRRRTLCGAGTARLHYTTCVTFDYLNGTILYYR